MNARSRYFEFLERQGKLPKREDELELSAEDDLELEDDAELEAAPEIEDERPRVALERSGEVDRSEFVRALRRPRF